MRLADFILANREPILIEWEAFARTCAPASTSMDVTDLRDHADEMLTVIAEDLRTAQGEREQSQKSKGNAPPASGPKDTAAQEHGADRAESGFSVEQMVSEYRALRASVIRLWTKSQGALALADLDDLTRFNEAIDQALAESIKRYTEDLNHSKEMFLAILGHDLRTPLGAVSTAAKFMLDTGELAEPHLTLTTRIARSSTRMIHLVGDLLDFTRSRLGSGIPVTRADVSIEKVVHDVVDELRTTHPLTTIRLDARDTERGDWDCARMTQALTNLVGNAIEHGAPDAVVNVAIRSTPDEVTIAIHNRGVAIPPDQIANIFSPMKYQPKPKVNVHPPTANLGLGLYIAERIVHAHNGRIDVTSTEERGTTFTVHLPRSEPRAAPPLALVNSRDRRLA